MAANDNEHPISYVAEMGSRAGSDGTEKRVHLGYSAEGFHAAIETTKDGQARSATHQWGHAYPTISAATEAAWNEVFKNDSKEQSMAELPEHVKAEADRAAANVNKAEIKMADAGPAIHERAAPYDVKAMEAQREQQRQNALDRKAPEAPEPGKE